MLRDHVTLKKIGALCDAVHATIAVDGGDPLGRLDDIADKFQASHRHQRDVGVEVLPVIEYLRRNLRIGRGSDFYIRDGE